MSTVVAAGRTLREKVVSGLAWSALQSGALKLIMFAVFTSIARVIGPGEIGTFAFVSTVIGLVGIFVDQGLSEAVVQRRSITPPQLNAVFMVNLATAVLLVVALWVAAPLIAAKAHLPAATPLLRVTSLGTLVGAAYFSQAAMLRRNFQYRWFTIATIVGAVSSGALGLLMAARGLGVWSLVAQNVGASVVTGAMLWMLPQWRFTFVADFAGIRQTVAYGLNRLAANVLDFANSKCLDLLIIATLGKVVGGIYFVGSRVQTALMQALGGAVLDVAHNSFSRLADDRPAVINAYYRAISVTAAVAVPVFVGAAAVAPELIEALFGADFADSAIVLRPLALLGAVQVLQFYNATLFNALGRPSLVLKLLVIKVIATLAAVGWARGTGLQGLVLAFVASQFVISPLNFYLLRKLVGVSLLTAWGRVWRFLAGCAVAYGGIALARSLGAPAALPAWARAVALTGVGGLIYLGVTALIARRQLAEVIGLFINRRSA